MTEKKQVVLGITHQGEISSEIGEFLFQARLPEGYSRFTLEAEGNTAAARNKLVELALEREEVEWFLLLEQDQVLHPWSLQYLIEEADRKAIKVLTPITFAYCFKFPIPILHDIKEAIHLDEVISSGFYKVEEISTQCVLIHRSVFEKIEKPWFKEQSHPMKVIDSYFSELCREAGFQLYLTEDVVADNAEVIDLKDYHNALELAIDNDREEICEELHDMIWDEGIEPSIVNSE